MNSEPTPIGASPSGNVRAPRMLTPKHRVRVFALASGLLLGHAADLSMGGMRVVGDMPIPTGQTLRVWAEIQGLHRERTRALLDVQSIWTSSTVDRGSYESGVCITDATREAAKGIEALMSELSGNR